VIGGYDFVFLVDNRLVPVRRVIPPAPKPTRHGMSPTERRIRASIAALAVCEAENKLLSEVDPQAVSPRRKPRRPSSVTAPWSNPYALPLYLRAHRYLEAIGATKPPTREEMATGRQNCPEVCP